MLAVIETHPVQYHAPVYRTVQERFGIPVTAIYGSDFSIVGYKDREFGIAFAWDTDLLSGYQSLFLERTGVAGTQTDGNVRASGLGRALRGLNPSAVLVLGYSPRFNQSAIHAAWRLGRPMLFRGETTDHAAQRSRLKSSVRDFLLTRFYRRCGRLLYVGERSRSHFERLGVAAGKLVFSPYCVATDVFECDEAARGRWRENARRETGASASDVVILFSGKIYFRKRPDLLVAAVKDLPEDLRQRIVLLFVGDGELRGQLEEAAGRAPKLRMHFAGFKNQKELSPYYHAADMLALSSQSETWGLVVNEALHHGVPCVLSDAVGCAPDLVGPGVTGEIFANGSAESLSAAILRAMVLINRAEIRENCRNRVAGYSVEKAAEGIALAYRQLITSKAAT